MLFLEDLRKYKNDVSTALERGQIASPSLLYTNHAELNDITRAGKGKYSTYSMVDKKLDDATIELNRVLKELDQELKDNRNRVKKLANSINGVKNEVVLRELIGTLLNNKISAIKTKVDIAVKADNARKSDIKLAIEMGGAGPAISNAVGDDNSFINTVINTDTITNRNSLYSFNSTPSNNPNIIKNPLGTVNPIKPSGTIMYDDLGEPTLDKSEAVEHHKPNKDNTELNSIIEETKLETPQVEYDHDSFNKITNALGEEGVLFEGESPYLNDYIPDNTVDQDLSRSEAFIKADKDDNVRIFFKYNEKMDAGHLIAIDESTMTELPNVTTLPLDLLYPWNVNKLSGTVTTMVREEYPVIFTEDPIDPFIMEQLDKIKSRYLENQNVIKSNTY